MRAAVSAHRTLPLTTRRNTVPATIPRQMVDTMTAAPIGSSPGPRTADSDRPRAAAVDIGAVSRPVRIVSRAVSPSAIATRKTKR